MKEFTPEERRKRIKATNKKPWVQLAQQERKIWNGFMRRHVGEDKWQKIIKNLPNTYPRDAKEYFLSLQGIPPMDDKEYSEMVGKFNIGKRQNPDLYIDFENCIFDENNFIVFSEFVFCSDVSFKNSVFEVGFQAKNAVFTGHLNFAESEFHMDCEFNNSIIKSKVDFNGAVFYKKAQFESVTFNEADFIGAEFKSLADFSKSQDGKITTFSFPPHFEGVKCEIIYFNKESFDNTTPYKDKDSLEEAASAWAALIRLMERVHNLPMRHEFHKKLLSVEAQYKTEKFAKPLYFIHSWMGAGQSALVPFCWWLALNVWSFAFYSYFVPIFQKALPFTLMNAIPFITTFNRQIVEKFIEGKDDVLSYIMLGAGVHTFLSGVLILLIGLALRNRFRVK